MLLLLGDSMDVIIGDIHGCDTELEMLLDKIGPSANDRIISLGDMVDRGPDAPRVVEFFRREGRIALMGNHERKHVLCSQQACKPALGQKITKEQFGSEYAGFLEYVKSLPLYIETNDAFLVHAALMPDVGLTEQDERVLVGSLGAQHLHEALPKQWYELVDRDKPVVFGHTSFDKPYVREAKAYGIDTNCVRGGMLTAITLPDFTLWSVKSKENYWESQKLLWKHPDAERLQERVYAVCEDIRRRTGSRRDFAAYVREHDLPSILFKAYDGRMSLKDVCKVADLIERL